MKRLLIAAATAALLLGVYGAIRWRQSERRQDEEAARQLVRADLGALTRIEINRRDAKPARIVLEKRGGVWWLADPITYRANGTAVESFVSQLDDKTYERSFTAPVSADYGLAPPLYTITWHAASTETTEIGSDTPFGGKVYAHQPGSDQILVVNGGFQYHLGKSVEDWRNKDVFFDFPATLVTITMVTEAARYQIASTDGVTWTGDGLVLDAGKVGALVDRLRNLMVREFLSDDAARDKKTWGLEKPARTMHLTGADGRRIDLAFGPLIDKDKTIPVLLADRNQVVSISQYVYENLFKSPQELKPDPPPPSATTDVSSGSAVSESAEAH